MRIVNNFLFTFHELATRDTRHTCFRIISNRKYFEYNIAGFLSFQNERKNSSILYLL